MKHVNPNSLAPSDLDRLLTESRWLGGLARQLVADPGLADDLVQETLISAMQASERPEPERTRGWLATILRNKLTNSFRSARRRDHRERAAARREALPGPDEIVELLESERLLRDALEVLPEPYRRTVALRYREGLSAAEIARRDGEPAGTVRWRLKSGLDQLRAELERRDRNWALALCPMLRLPLPIAAQAAGATVASKLAWGAVAAAAVLFGAVGVWWWVQPDPVEPVQRAGASSLVAAAAAGEVNEATTPAPQPAVDEPIERRSAPSPAAAQQASDTEARPKTFGRVELRVVDEQGNPIPGAVARRYDDEPRPPLGEPADFGGRLELGFDLLYAEQRPWEVSIEATGFGTRHIEVVARNGLLEDAGDVVLPPGASAHGFAVDPSGTRRGGGVVFVGPLDERDLAAFADGVPLHELEDLFEELEWISGFAMIDPGNGEFWLEGVQAGRPGHVLALHDDHGGVAAVSPLFELRPGEVLEVGQLEFADSQQPLENATRPSARLLLQLEPGVDPQRFEVSAWFTERNSSQAIRVERLEDPAAFQLSSMSSIASSVEVLDRQGRYRPSSLRDVDLDGSTLTVAPELTPWVELEVVEPDGEPAVGVRFHWAHPSGDDAESTRPVAFQTSDAGRYRFLPPARPYTLRIEGADAVFDLGIQPRSGYGGPARVQLVSGAAPSGRVVRDGLPVADATVEVGHLLPETEAWITGSIFARVREFETPVRSVTDEQGRFRLPAVPNGALALAVSVEGRVQRVVEWRPEADLAIELDELGAISGTVSFGGGEPRSGIVTAWNALGMRRSVSFDAGRGFELEALPPGRWYLRETRNAFGVDWMAHSEFDGVGSGYAVWQPPGGVDTAQFQSVLVRAGASTPVTLQLEPDAALPIRGRVRIDGGRPRGGQAWLERSVPHGTPKGDPLQLEWRRNGSLEGLAPGGGAWAIRMECEPFATYTVRVDLDEADPALDLDLELRTGTVVVSSSSEWSGLVLASNGAETGAGTVHGSVFQPWAGGGEIEVPGVLAGTVRVIGVDPSTGPVDTDRLVTATLEPGARIELSIP